MPRFDVERFSVCCGRAFWGSCHVFDVLASTNTCLYAGAARRSEGTIVLADEQTAGRGQADKVWISPPRCNLYVSVLCADRPCTGATAIASGSCRW